MDALARTSLDIALALFSLLLLALGLRAVFAVFTS